MGVGAEMERRVEIKIELPSVKQVGIFLESLVPETKKVATSRAKVFIEGRGKNLLIRIEAKDTSAVRATINSYLRWVALLRDTYGVIAKLSARSCCENT